MIVLLILTCLRYPLVERTLFLIPNCCYILRRCLSDTCGLIIHLFLSI